MPTFTEQLQRVWHAYEAEHGNFPVTAREAVLWGVSQGMIRLPPPDPVAQMAQAMSRALREELGVDDQGRRFRKNHAVRIVRGGVQITIWARMENAPFEFMRDALMQRRNAIIGDCVQLHTDATVYNVTHPEQTPIQLSFDFSSEVARRQKGGQTDLFIETAA